ncbi:hypothetical protein SVIOM342S_00466 [Streptomyces violaceorubidus]
MDVDAAAGQLGVQFALGDVPGAAAVGVDADVLGESLGAHAEHVERGGPRERGEQVRAGRTPAPDRLVDDDGGAVQLAGPAVAGVDDAVLDDGGRCRTRVPHQPVEVGDVDEGDTRDVRGRVAGAGHVAVGGVVLQVDQRRAAAQPAVDQAEFVRALEDHEVDVLVPQPLRRYFHDGVWPVPGAGAAEAVGAAVLGDGDEVGVRALHEGRGPRPVHVPDEDPHASPSSFSTAAATSVAVTVFRQGWPGTGQSRALLSAQGASWSPSRT